MMISKRYFTFQDIIDQYELSPNYNPAKKPQKPHDYQIASDWFTTIIGDFKLAYYAYGLSSDFTSTILNEVVNQVMTIVYNRHAYDFIYSKWGFDPNLDNDDLEPALRRLISVLELTMPRYVVILKQNTNYSTNPVDKITSKSTGRTRFNDTPQDEGEYNDEEHASNVSKTINESEVDSGSIMERLEAMFKNFRSIILEWANEFNMCFIKEEQIQ